MKSIRLYTLAVCALLGASLRAFAADPNGTWKFHAEGPGGRSADATLMLTWRDNQLSGTVEGRAGKASISEAKFADDQISFTVVRELGRRFRKQTITTRYSGKLEGDTIKGTIQTTGREQQAITIPWEAHRAK